MLMQAQFIDGNGNQNLVPLSAGLQRTITVTAGTTSAAIYQASGTALPTPLSVAITPGNGGTAKVQYTISGAAAIAGNTATWHDWDNGTVSAFTQARLVSPVMGLRAVATTADAVFEVAG